MPLLFPSSPPPPHSLEIAITKVYSCCAAGIARFFSISPITL